MACWQGGSLHKGGGSLTLRHFPRPLLLRPQCPSLDTHTHTLSHTPTRTRHPVLASGPASGCGTYSSDKLGNPTFIQCGCWGNFARPMRLPHPSPALDKNRAPIGPEILSSTGAGVWRRAPMAFPDSSSVLDKFQSATNYPLKLTRPG